MGPKRFFLFFRLKEGKGRDIPSHERQNGALKRDLLTEPFTNVSSAEHSLYGGIEAHLIPS
jgi:hypothetical protein